MGNKPQAVQEYLDGLSEERRVAIEAVIELGSMKLDGRLELGMQYGMPAWYLPHSEYPSGYHADPKQPLPFASIASKKRHIGLYLFFVYCDEDAKEQFVEEWKASGERLDMGASCVRVKDLGGIPMDVLGRAFKRMTAKRFVAAYESSIAR